MTFPRIAPGSDPLYGCGIGTCSDALRHPVKCARVWHPVPRAPHPNRGAFAARAATLNLRLSTFLLAI